MARRKKERRSITVCDPETRKELAVWRRPSLVAGKWRAAVRYLDGRIPEVQNFTLDLDRKAERKIVEAVWLKLAHGDLTQAKISANRLRQITRKVEPITLGEALRRWAEAIITKTQRPDGTWKFNYRPSTLKSYERTFHLLKASLGADACLADLKFEPRISDMLNDWSARFRGWKDHLCRARKFFRYCYKPARWTTEYLLEGWAATYQSADLEEEGEKRALTDEEILRLLDAAKTAYESPVKWLLAGGEGRPGLRTLKPPVDLHLLVLSGLYTGMRAMNLVGPHSWCWGPLPREPRAKGEVLLPAGVDTSTGTLVIDKSDMKVARNGDFVIPLHPVVIEALKKRLRDLGRPPLPGEKVISELPLDCGLRSGFVSAVKRAGLAGTGTSFHTLRHTFATRTEEIAPTRAWQRLLHHAPSAKGARTDAASAVSLSYAHPDLDAMRRALDQLPGPEVLRRRVKAKADAAKSESAPQGAEAGSAS